MTSKNAHFFAVDGIDGVGKSTQIRRLAELLNGLGIECVTTRDPGSTEIGRRLRELLLESSLTMHRRTEAMLFMASRCEMIETTIKPTLDSGTSIISDRFLLANVVYQSVCDGGNAVPPETLWRMGELANDGLRPDLTILLDMPAERAMGRIDRPADRMESRGIAYMESVRQSYLAQLHHASNTTAVINADQTADEVHRDIRSAVENYLAGSN
ncbi:MAG: dTMP kinase [Planctomycetales bacterium]|nr:dTMP kinase [Planctomycetales bacterium]